MLYVFCSRLRYCYCYWNIFYQIKVFRCWCSVTAKTSLLQFWQTPSGLLLTLSYSSKVYCWAFHPSNSVNKQTNNKFWIIFQIQLWLNFHLSPYLHHLRFIAEQVAKDVAILSCYLVQCYRVRYFYLNGLTSCWKTVTLKIKRKKERKKEQTKEQTNKRKNGRTN